MQHRYQNLVGATFSKTIGFIICLKSSWTVFQFVPMFVRWWISTAFCQTNCFCGGFLLGVPFKLVANRLGQLKGDFCFCHERWFCILPKLVVTKEGNPLQLTSFFLQLEVAERVSSPMMRSFMFIPQICWETSIESKLQNCWSLRLTPQMDPELLQVTVSRFPKGSHDWIHFSQVPGSGIGHARRAPSPVTSRVVTPLIGVTTPVTHLSGKFMGFNPLYN